MAGQTPNLLNQNLKVLRSILSIKSCDREDDIKNIITHFFSSLLQFKAEKNEIFRLKKSVPFLFSNINVFFFQKRLISFVNGLKGIGSCHSLTDS